MIRKMGNKELFELCETIPKVQCSHCLSLLESRSDILHLWTLLGWKRIQKKASQIKTGCSLNPALRHQNGAVSWCQARQNRGTISWPTMRGGDVSKRILMEFKIVSKEIQYIVIRNSKLAGPRRSASKWINWHRQKQLLLPIFSEEYERNEKKPVYLTEQIRQKCTNETPIILPNSSHNYEPSPPRIWRRTTWTNPFSSLPKVTVVFFFFHCLMVAVVWKLEELIFFDFVVARSFTADSNMLHSMGVWTEHPHTSHFSRDYPHSW